MRCEYASNLAWKWTAAFVEVARNVGQGRKAETLTPESNMADLVRCDSRCRDGRCRDGRCRVDPPHQPACAWAVFMCSLWLREAAVIASPGRRGGV